jgi:lysophospholipase L1-like esterase
MKLLRSLAALLCLMPVVAWAAGASLPPFGANTPLTLPNGSTTSFSAALASRPSQTVTQRAPTATDDLSSGYAIGHLWNFNGTIYQALQVTVGKAVWQPISAAQGLPTDAAATPLAAYSNRALNVAWLNGNWIDVSATAGGTATTIKFINGQPDIAALVKVIGGGLGYVSKWYDQSGSTLDATQTTATNQPTIRADVQTGGVPSIIFDSVINGGTTTQKFLTLPAGVTATANADSLFVVGRAYSSRRAVAFAQLTNASFTQTLSSNAVGGATAGQALTYFYGAAYRTASPALTEQVMGWTSSSTAQQVYSGNSYNAYSPQAANTMAGGFIGSISASGNSATGYAELSAVVIYARGLSATDTLNLRGSLTRLFNLTPHVQDVWVVDGDSITEGYGSTALQNMPRKALGLLNTPMRVYDTALYGDTVSGRISAYPTYAGAMYRAAARNNILSIAAGTNDLGTNNATGAATYALLTQYINMAHATGFKVMCATVLPFNFTSSAETERQNYNTLIRANSGGSYGAAGVCDALADIAADPTMGALSALSNTSLYFDGLHPADLGYAYLAPIYAKAVQGLLKP